MRSSIFDFWNRYSYCYIQSSCIGTLGNERCALPCQNVAGPLRISRARQQPSRYDFRCPSGMDWCRYIRCFFWRRKKKKKCGKYFKRRSEHREWSTVVKISIPSPSFKLVSLSSPRSPLSKTPKHVIFLTLSTFCHFYYTTITLFIKLYFFSFNVQIF